MAMSFRIPVPGIGLTLACEGTADSIFSVAREIG